MKKCLWIQKLGILLAASLLCGQSWAAQATATSMNVTIGTWNGSVSALGGAGDGRVVNFYTNRRGNLSVVFKFSVAQLTSTIQMSALMRQHTGSDTFRFQALNSSGAWVDVGSTSGGVTYKSVKLALPAGSVVQSNVSLRMVSSSGADDLEVDQLILMDQSTTNPTPTTTTLPTPTTTTVPVVTTTTTTLPNQVLKLTPGTTWYWQLSGQLKTNVAAKVYDIDLFDTSASTIQSLKAAGHTVICYYSAGTYEDWRSDAEQIPVAARGSNVSGWAGEKWLDVRNAGVRDVMAKRMDLAKSKGCDGLEPDNVDGYANRSGFPLTMQDQIQYNTFLADQAHARGMIVALKNATDLVSALVNKFDFAVVEECFKYNECSAYSPFVQQNKAVLNAEYSSKSSAICSQAATLRFSTVFFNLNLDGSVYNPCP